MNGTDSVYLQQKGGIFKKQIVNKETFPVGTFMFRRLIGEIRTVHDLQNFKK
jgi:hypothetical protein